MDTIHVAAAVILKGDRVFATQRGYGPYKDKWEFPGGKLEKGETPEQALTREIKEELTADVNVGRRLIQVTYDYPEFHLVMDCYLCTVPSGGLKLVEHESARWLTIQELDQVDWLEADKQTVEAVKKFFKEAERQL
jgi:8-oxo-dGTP diphosphatase